MNKIITTTLIAGCLAVFSTQVFAETDYLSGNEKTGKEMTKRLCTECHNLGEPSFFDLSEGGNIRYIFNKKLGSSKFSSSRPLKEKGGVWNAKKLYLYIDDPQKFITGTKMKLKLKINKQNNLDMVKYLYSLRDAEK